MKLNQLFSKKPPLPKFVMDPSWVNYYDDQDRPHRRRLVMVNVKKFDKLWFNTDPNFYIGKKGKGQIKDRYQRFEQFAKTANQPIQASTVGISDRGISFYNGRHRFAWFRDQGYSTIPMAMDASSIRIAKQLGVLVDGN